MTAKDELLKTFTTKFLWDDTSPDFEQFASETGPVVEPFITPQITLEQIYANLPARFPPLFEQLVLNYRWQRACLGSFCLLANPPGRNLIGLISEIHRDPHLSACSLANGFIQFATAPDCDYDPICFDTNKTSRSADFRVVVLDHEAILCRDKIRVTSVLAENFEALIRTII